jgi:hypothetical protein
MTNKLVTIATCFDTGEAVLVRNRLAEAGLRAFLSDENASATAWQLTAALGGIKVQVAEDDVPTALAVLNERPASLRELEKEALASGREERFAEGAGAEDDAREEDKADVPISRIDALVDRAFKAAVFGLLFFPLQIYSLQLLAEAYFDDEDISPSRRGKAWGALLLNLPLLFYLALFGRLLYHWLD